MSNDFRFAFRMLLKNPAFTVVAVAVLALGIGANSAMFSVINAVLLRPLPYEKPEELVLFWERIPQMQFAFVPTSEGGFVDWRTRNTVFTDMAGFRNNGVTLTGRGPAERISALQVSASLFPLLGVSPVLGRAFTPQESRPGGQPVVMLSHSIWQSRFGANSEVVGEKLLLDGQPYTVVGILPAGFEFPPPILLLDNMFDWDPQLFLPFAPQPDVRGSRGTISLARLKPGVSLEQARADLRRVAESLVRDYPDNNPPGLDVVLSPLHGQAVSRSRTPLLVLLGAVTLLLLIACVNVANLLLARAVSRFREIAIRMALGAGRGQVMRQLLIESLILALAGALAGTLLAYASLELLVRLGEGQIPNMGPVTIDWTVLAFTLTVAVGTGVLFGLAPALQALRPDLNESLKEGTRGSGISTAGRRFRSALVMAEVALAVILLVGAGLLLRSLVELQGVQLGFRPQGLLTVGFELPRSDYGQEFQQWNFYERMEQEIQALPGVEQAGFVNHLPLGRGRSASNYEIEGRPPDPDRERFQLADIRRASPGYFQAMQIPLLEGRLINQSDLDGSTVVILVNRALAERNWPDGSALGARLTLDDADDPEAAWLQVVGVVENVKQSGLEGASQDAFYLSLMQAPSRSAYLAIRPARAGAELTGAIRERFAAQDPALPLNIQSMTFYVQQAGAQRRSPTILLGIFASLAVVLALVGLYGVMSYLVSQRTQEIGIRLALGAQRRDVVGLIATQTARLVLAGLALGMAGALAVSQVLSGMLYEISPADPLTFAAVALLF
ncbi:MAG: ABC transporter permease, partial [Acidobacteriota bacterium]